MNVVFYNERYDSYGAIPEWARKSLKSHQKDRRPSIYSLEHQEKEETQTGLLAWPGVLESRIAHGPKGRSSGM
jgi:hypothetical protein